MLINAGHPCQCTYLRNLKKKKKPVLAMKERYSLFRREFWRRGVTPAALVY
jgi:hypothetical protein